MGFSGNLDYLLLGLALAGVVAGCGNEAAGTSSQQEASVQAEAQAEQAEPAEPQEQQETQRQVIAADDFSNLQLKEAALPVFDKYTLAERRAKGLPVQLPQLAPYREGKVAYLTFDDGPDDKNTTAILDILKENNVLATFYVTGRSVEANPEVLKRIYAEGHAIGNHSYDHDYNRLYASPDNFLAEMEQTDEIIKGVIGVRPLNLRAPGGVIGHFNASYDAALLANGYVEHDWNVSSADAAPNHPVAQDFIDNINGQTEGDARPQAIILMHCSGGHEETVKALPEIIRLLKAKGYAFGVVTPMTPQPW